MQLPLINAYAEVSSEGRGINFSVNLYLHPYFIYACREGSGDSPELSLLAI